MCKRLMLVLLVLYLLLPAALAETAYYTRGQKVDDFSLTALNGDEITLYEVLKEREIVLLHFFAGSCGACEEEFPLLQQAYELYDAKVEVIAVSIDPGNTEKQLLTYAQRRGLTFPIARDTAGLSGKFPVHGVPLSVVIDRFGTLCYIKEGAVSTVDEFLTIFEAYVGDPEARQKKQAPIADESGTVPEMAGMLPEQPQDAELTPWGSCPQDIPTADLALIADALNVPGGHLAFLPAEDASVWPMIPAQDDQERAGVTSTNVMQDGSTSALRFNVTAQAGDALSVTFSLSSEEARDWFIIRINGEPVKSFSGIRERMAWAYQFPANGEYTVELAYEKDELTAAGEDCVFVEEVAHLSGDAAAAAVAANAVFPASGAVMLSLTNADARQIVFDDPTYALLSLFGLADYYIVPGEAAFQITLKAEMDPEGAILISGYDNVPRILPPMADDDGYTFTTPVDSPEATGYTHTAVQLYPFAGCSIMDVRTVVCFADEAAVQSFISDCVGDGLNIVGWRTIEVSNED